MLWPFAVLIMPRSQQIGLIALMSLLYLFAVGTAIADDQGCSEPPRLVPAPAADGNPAPGRTPVTPVAQIAGEQPAGEQPAGEQPAADQPAAEQPAADQPAADQPAAEQPGPLSPSGQQILERFIRECVTISPGTPPFPQEFGFGSPEPRNHAIPQRVVSMPQSFRISQFEVTQELYATVMKVNPSRWQGPRNSAESMTFRDAQQFCERLTELLQAQKLIEADERVRLPTEIEWEYCCRAGTTTRYSFGDEAAAPSDVPPVATLLDAYAWHTGNAAGNDPEVGVLKPNAWNLFDMHGYLSEFVTDAWSTSGREASTDRDAADRDAADRKAADRKAADDSRVVRGGSWKDPFTELTSTSRRPMNADAVSDAVGLRCVIVRPRP